MNKCLREELSYRDYEMLALGYCSRHVFPSYNTRVCNAICTFLSDPNVSTQIKNYVHEICDEYIAVGGINAPGDPSGLEIVNMFVPKKIGRLLIQKEKEYLKSVPSNEDCHFNKGQKVFKDLDEGKGK